MIKQNVNNKDQKIDSDTGLKQNLGISNKQNLKKIKK